MTELDSLIKKRDELLLQMLKTQHAINENSGMSQSILEALNSYGLDYYDRTHKIRNEEVALEEQLAKIQAQLEQTQNEIIFNQGQPLGDDILDHKVLMGTYDLVTVNSSVIQYSQAVQKFVDELLEKTEKYQQENSDTLNALAGAGGRLARRYEPVSVLTDEQNQFLKKNEDFFRKHFVVGFDRVKKQLYAIRAQAEAMEDRLEDINDGTNAIVELADLVQEKRVDFSFLAENCTAIVNNAMARLDFLQHHQEYAAFAVTQWEEWASAYAVLRTTTGKGGDHEQEDREFLKEFVQFMDDMGFCKIADIDSATLTELLCRDKGVDGDIFDTKMLFNAMFQFLDSRSVDTDVFFDYLNSDDGLNPEKADSYTFIKTVFTFLHERQATVPKEVCQRFDAQWHKQWTMMVTMLKPVFLKGVKGGLPESAIRQAVSLLGQYRRAVDAFYNEERAAIYERHAEKAYSDVRDMFDGAYALFQKFVAFYEGIQDIVLSLERDDEKLFLLQWPAELWTVPLDNVLSEIAKQNIQEISPKVLAQLAALKQSDWFACRNDQEKARQLLAECNTQYGQLVEKIQSVLPVVKLSDQKSLL
jgi:hypothetical protein